MRRIVFFILALMSLNGALSLSAQTQEWKLLHKGNRAFMRNEMTAAETYYLEALKINPRNSRAQFNIGDVYLAQGNSQGAWDKYKQAAQSEKNKVVKAMAYHNMGYILHTNKKYKEAIDFYKEALRNNPNDDDTRYNLALCQKMLKEDQKDNQNQQQNKNDQNNQQQQQNKNNKEQQQQQEQQQMSNDNAQQLLNLSQQAERDTRKKLQDAQQPRRKTLDKNW